jgi:hypothetical protein
MHALEDEQQPIDGWIMVCSVIMLFYEKNSLGLF